jgi:hypothetical protein
MRLQPTLYRDESDKGGAVVAETKATAATEQTKPADFAGALMKALDERTSRAETGVLKSMASQYGLTEEEAKAVFDKAKADKASKLPETAQKQIDEARAEVQRMRVESAISKEGAALGLIDPDVALQLLPADAIKVDAKGVVTGIKETLEELKKTKPYLFKTTTGQRVDVGGKVTGTTDTAEAAYAQRMQNAIRGGRPLKPDDKK